MNQARGSGWALATVGLSLYWPLLRKTSHFTVIGGHLGAADIGPQGWLALSLLFSAVALLLAVGILGRAEKKSRHRPVHALPGRPPALMVAALAAIPAQGLLKCLEILVSPAGGAAVALGLADTALWAAGYVALTWAWAQWSVRVPHTAAEVVFLASFAMSLFPKLVLALPRQVGECLLSALPTVSLICWALCSRAAGRPGAVNAMAPSDGEARAISSASETSREREAGETRQRDSSRRTVAILSVFLIVCAVVCGFSPDSLSGVPVEPVVTSQDLVSLLVGGLIVAAYAIGERRGSFVRVTWSVLALVVFLGLLLAAFGPDMYAVGRQLLVVGRTCMGLLLWIVLARQARETGGRGAGRFTVVFVLVDIASSTLGYLVVPALIGRLGTLSDQLPAALCLGVSFILIVSSFVLFNAEAAGRATAGAGTQDMRGRPEQDEATAPGAEDALDAHLDKVSESFGLTIKESEVAALLVRGNSQKRIAELLGVSLSAVQARSKSLYRKLGIHSRQELVDMIGRCR